MQLLFVRYKNIFIILGVFFLLLGSLLVFNFLQSRKLAETLEGVPVKVDSDVYLQEINEDFASDLEYLVYDAQNIALDVVSLDNGGSGDESSLDNALVCNEDNECIKQGSQNPVFIKGMHGFSSEAELNDGPVVIKPDEELPAPDPDEGPNYLDLLLINGELSSKDSYYIEGVVYALHSDPLNFLWTQRPQKEKNISEGHVLNEAGEKKGFYYIRRVEGQEQGDRYDGFLFIEGVSNVLNIRLDLEAPQIPESVLAIEIL